MGLQLYLDIYFPNNMYYLAVMLPHQPFYLLIPPIHGYYKLNKGLGTEVKNLASSQRRLSSSEFAEMIDQKPYYHLIWLDINALHL